ncbi:hypothetical protein KZZ20_08960 [Methylacidiphilum fumariolicum]|nr:hypothetical protein [Candidatus Methylacidiphilum fumarolicum]MBW6415637.1 hypothetical protein [Candidatus Methylacidiphilum fumarolicum]
MRKNQKLLDDVKKAVEESQSGSSLHNRAGLTQYLGHLLRQGSGDHTVQIQLGADQVVETLCGGGKPSTCLPKLSQPSFRHQLNAMKREQFPCMLEVTKNASQMAIGQLGVACKNFWAGRAKYPKYRKTGGPDCFPLTRELGLADNAPIPKSTRLPVTENAKKVIAKLSSLHACIANIRQDACRQFTSNLTRRFHSIVIKDLHGEGILKSHPLAWSIADGSVFEFWRQLEYKAEWWGWPIAGLRPAIPLWLVGGVRRKFRWLFDSGPAWTVEASRTGR